VDYPTYLKKWEKFFIKNIYICESIHYNKRNTPRTKIVKDVKNIQLLNKRCGIKRIGQRGNLNMTVTMTNTNQKLTLHEMRKQSGKSGAAVSRLCGVSYRTLRNWEAGINIPNVVNIQDLLQIYGYAFVDLDLTPFFASYHERTVKQTHADDQLDNVERDRRQFEQELQTNTQQD